MTEFFLQLVSLSKTISILIVTVLDCYVGLYEHYNEYTGAIQ